MTKKKQTPEEKRVYMKCRRAPPCDSIEAVEIKYAQGVRLYRCAKCKHHFAVQVGGKMDLRSI